MNRSNPAARSAPVSRSRSLLALALAVTLLVAGLGGAPNPVVAEDGETPMVTDQSAPLVGATAVAPETPLPESPTEIATEPSPPEIPETPTEAAETPTETVTPTETPTVIPTIAPTPVVVPDELYCEEPTSAQGGSGWLFETTCAYVVNSQRAETRIVASIASATTDGWTVELRDPASGTWTSAGSTASFGDAVNISPNSAINIAVRITTPTTGHGGEQVTIQLGSEIVGPAGETRPGPTTTISATVPQPPASRARMVSVTAAPFPLQCTGPTAVANEPLTVSYHCDYSITFEDSGNSTITITASAANGWDVGLQASIAGRGTMTSPLNGDGVATISYSKGGPATSVSGSVQLLVRAPAGSTGGASSPVSLTHVCGGPPKITEFCASLGDKGGMSIVATLPTPRCADPANPGVTAALSGVTLTPVAYSASPQTNGGAMTLTVQNPSRCTGWGVTISGTDLRYSGAAPNQAPIPVENVRVTIPGQSPVQLSSQAKSLVADGGTNTQYTYPVEIALDIPGGSAAGTYTSTVTIATISAPQ